MIPVTINNTTLWYDRLIYVDVTAGDDVNGDGSETKPFKSIGRAIDDVNSPNTAIIVRPGVYNEVLKNDTTVYNNDDYALFIPKVVGSNTYGYDVIGDSKGNTVVNVDFNRDFAYLVSITSNNTAIKLYNVVFNLNVQYNAAYSSRNCIVNESYGRSSYCTFVANNCVFNFTGQDYRRGIVRKNSSTTYLIFNNCIFNFGSGAMSYTGYSDGSGGYTYFYNCIFNGLRNWTSSYGGYPALILNRCIESNCGTSYSGVTRNQPIVQNVVFDDRYFITNTDVWVDSGWGLNPSGTPASIGVYGGPFAWGGGGNIDIQIPAPNVTISGGMDYNFQFSIKVPSGGSNSIVFQNMDQEGTLGSGTLYSKTINKNSFNKILRVEVK